MTMSISHDWGSRRGNGLMKFELRALLALALMSGGCTTAPHCEELGKCGGDFTVGAMDMGDGVPIRQWVASASDACVDQVPAQPEPPSLAFIPPRPAGIRPVEPSTIDWCSGLRLQHDEANDLLLVEDFDDGWYEVLKRYDGWFPSVPLFTAQVTFGVNNQYTAELTQLAAQHVELSKTCLVAQGVNPSCQDLSQPLVDKVTEMLDGLKGLNAAVYGNEGRDVCVSDGGDGCTCDYNVALTSAVSGPWAASNDGRLTFFDADAAPPGRAGYCADSTLQLTGDKGADLFNRSSLKTLELRAPTCTDRVQSVTNGETGVDCGGPCPPCP